MHHKRSCPTTFSKSSSPKNCLKVVSNHEHYNESRAHNVSPNAALFSTWSLLQHHIWAWSGGSRQMRIHHSCRWKQNPTIEMSVLNVSNVSHHKLWISKNILQIPGRTGHTRTHTTTTSWCPKRKDPTSKQGKDRRKAKRKKQKNWMKFRKTRQNSKNRTAHDRTQESCSRRMH